MGKGQICSPLTMSRRKEADFDSYADEDGLTPLLSDGIASFKPLGHDRKLSSSQAIVLSASGISETASLTNLQSCVHLIKGTVGTAILAMPAACRDAGIVLGPLGVFLVGLLIVHTMHMVIEVTQFLRRHYNITDDQDDLDYIGTVRVTLKYSPTTFRSYFSWLPSYLRFCLVSSQIGILSVYFNFIAENTKYMVEYYDPVFKPSLLFYQAVIFGLLIPMSFFKSLKRLAAFSGLANALASTSILISLFYFVTHLQPISTLPAAKSMETIPMFFGVVVFGFETINVILPCENKMIEKTALTGHNGVLNLAMIPSVCLFTAVSFYGYLCFGENVKGSFTYSIPMEPWYYMPIKPMYTASVFVSFGLQFFIQNAYMTDIFDNFNIKRITPKTLDVMQRISTLVLIFVLGSLVPHIDLMISLVGAFSGSSIAIMIPCVIHSVIVWRHFINKNPWMRKQPISRTYMLFILIKNSCIFLIGIVGAIIGTYTTIISIIHVFDNSIE